MGNKLISADFLLKQIEDNSNENIDITDITSGSSLSQDALVKLINSQPIVYDLDDVCTTLACMSERNEKGEYCVEVNDAIWVIRGGETNE